MLRNRFGSRSHGLTVAGSILQSPEGGLVKFCESSETGSNELGVACSCSIVVRMAAHWYEEQQSWIDACCRQLVAQGVAEPLSKDERGTRDWSLRQLASLVEGHL